MMSPHFRSLAYCLAAGVVALPLAPKAVAQAEEALFVATDKLQEPAVPATPEKAKTLLDELRRTEIDRQIALKQTEIERIKQDQAKAEEDTANIQKNIDSLTSLIDGSNDEVAKLTSESRRLEHELALAEARIASERLKVEGMRALSIAQSKSLSALARHAEVSEARARLRSAELSLLKDGKPIPAETKEELAQSEIGKCRKALALAEAKTEAEDRAAREAMKAAAAKMELADAKALTAKRISENDLTLPPVAEKSRPKPTEKRESDAPVRRPPVVSASSTPKPAPKPAAGAAPARTTTTNTPARGPFFGR